MFSEKVFTCEKSVIWVKSESWKTVHFSSDPFSHYSFEGWKMDFSKPHIYHYIYVWTAYPSKKSKCLTWQTVEFFPWISFCCSVTDNFLTSVIRNGRDCLSFYHDRNWEKMCVSEAKTWLNVAFSQKLPSWFKSSSFNIDSKKSYNPNRCSRKDVLDRSIDFRRNTKITSTLRKTWENVRFWSIWAIQKRLFHPSNE